MVSHSDKAYHIEGQIDSGNAAEFEEKLMALHARHQELEPVLDVKNLKYISSAGLRVLLELRKKTMKVTIRNASPEVYEILEITGFTDVLDVKKALAFVSTKDLPVISEGEFGNTYRVDASTIMKTYQSSFTVKQIQRAVQKSKSTLVDGDTYIADPDVVETENGHGVLFRLISTKGIGKSFDSSL